MNGISIVERKCLSCGTWNKDEDFCTNCGTAISQKQIDKETAEKRRIEEANRPKDKFQLFMENLKNHRFLLFRFFYKVLYTIGVIFAIIGGFFAWIVAMANG